MRQKAEAWVVKRYHQLISDGLSPLEAQEVLKKAKKNKAMLRKYRHDI